MDFDIDVFLRRQKILADFGDFALQSEDLDAVLTEACRLVGQAMFTNRAKVLELEEGGKTLLVRAGVGWAADIVGKLRLLMSERSSESFSIEQRTPVISKDINEEDRFDVPDFMKQAGVLALVNVPIFLPGGRAFGLLQVDDTKSRDFDQNDIEFMRTYATILGPIVDRLFKVQALRSADERLRLIASQAVDYAIFVTDPEDKITDWLPGAAAIFGWSEEEATGQPAEILFTPEDRQAGEPRKETETASKEGVAPDVRWHLRKDGSRVFINGSTRVLRDAAGQTVGFLKIGQDVTEQRALRDREQVLLRELQHRTRNLMSVVRGIADQTLRFSSGLPEFRVRFRDRIDALQRAQNLLSELQEVERVAFDDLLEHELAALGDRDMVAAQTTLEGPRGVPLRSGTMQTFALALHELCTNALKYGALRQPNSHLSVRWHVTREDGTPWLHMDWRETGVAMQEASQGEGSGAGRELIEKALPYQLGAKVTYSLEADGVHCTIALPISETYGWP